MFKHFVACSLLASFSFAAQQYSATSTRFSPAPINLDLSNRIAASVILDSAPTVDFQTSYVYKIWDGFDVGLGLHGGMIGQDQLGGVIGTDLMLRYVRPVTFDFFLGFQSQIGYTYTGMGNSALSKAEASSFPLTVGVVLGGIIQDRVEIYFFPACELGQTSNQNDRSMWKSGVGLRLTLGTAISLAENIFWVVESVPVISNFTGSGPALKTFNVGTMTGLLFDF